MPTAGQPLYRANRLADRILRRQALGKKTGQAERRLGRVDVGQAQLGSALNSNDPRLRGQAEAYFRRHLQQNPDAMGQFWQAVGGGAPPPTEPDRIYDGRGGPPPTAGGAPHRPGAGKTPGAGNSAGTSASPGGPAFTDALSAQFGTGNPFGVRELGGPNPLQTAVTGAQRMLDENLAGTRSRFAGGGLGNSDRAALAEGQAIADTSTFLGDKLANIAENAYQNDAGRSLQAILGAAQNDLARSGLALQANQQLGGFGTGLTGIGAQETQIPNLGEILGTLAAFATSLGGGTSKGSGAQGFGWKR